MKVADVMTRGVGTCHLDDSMNAAAQIMWEGDFGCVAVVDSDGKAVSMITDRDICMAAYTQGERLTQMPVSSADSRTLFAVHEHDSISDVEAIMNRHRVRRVPVIDQDGRPIGIVSMNDLARNATMGRSGDALNPDYIVKTLAAVCRPNGMHASAAE